MTLLVIAGAVAGAWMANVEPLGPGSVNYGKFDVRISSPVPPPTVSSFDVDAFGAWGTVVEVPARSDLRFSYHVSIRNDGSVPIQVRSVGDGRDGGQTSRYAVGMKLDLTHGRMDLGFVPFAPFVLEPGEEAAVEMLVVVVGDPCLSVGSWTSWSWEPVTFRLLGPLGPTRHMDAPTSTEIRIVGDGHTDC